MNRVFQWLHAQRRAVLAALAVAVALGAWQALRMPAAILPEVTFPRIKVIADSGERPGEEMLRAVTRPLEASLRRVPGLREMRSTTSRGSVEINLDCEWGTDMDLALQRVQARMDAARGLLPDATTLEAQIMNPALFPVLGVSLTSRTRSLAELRDLAVMRLEPELARLPGVAQVVIQGGDRLEARVTLDPPALEGRGLDAAAVADAIRGSDALETVGLLEANRELYLGIADARPANLDALAAVPVPIEGGPAVTVGQLGTVTLTSAPQFTRYAARSRDAVLINFLRQPSASTLGVSRAAHQWLAQHRGLLPDDVTVQTFYDQADLVRASVDSVRDSLLFGALMAVIIVLLFLGRLDRLGFAGAMVLPGSIGLTLLGLSLTHQSLNLMTLGGIAAAVGLVLDDAIVVVEHFDHALQGGAEVTAVAGAMADLFPSLLGSSLCTLAIFIPFMFLGGVTGAFFRVLALAMALMLASSLALCLTVLPRFAQWGRRRRAAAARRGPDRFARLLGYASTHAWVAILPPLLLVIAIPVLQAGVGSGFLPEMDEGSLILDYITPSGTSVVETERMLHQVEAQLDSTREIVAWSRRTGDQLGFFITEPNMGDYVLRLASGRRRPADAIADDLRDRIAARQPAIEVEFGQLIEDVIGDLTTSPQPIEVRLFGEDRRVLEARARDAATLLEKVRGVVDVKSGVVVSGPNIAVVPGVLARRAGLGAAELARAVEPYVQGIGAGEIQRGARSWPVRVVLPMPVGALGPDALAGARVPVAKGRWTRLGELAELRVNPGETEIARDNQRTMVAVTARLSGRDLGSAMTEIQRLLRRDLPLGPGMGIQYSGLWEEQQSSFRGLAIVLIGATAAVMLLLLVSFRSWRRALVVMVVAIASLAGAFLALRVFGATFNVTSFVGAIMVVGIVAENAYFLVMEHQRGLGEGMPPAEAAAAAARRRARPILMTTAAGVAALSPLAFAAGAGNALLRPLALAVVGGFTVSALLLLLVLPALLARTGSGTRDDPEAAGAA